VCTAARWQALPEVLRDDFGVKERRNARG